MERTTKISSASYRGSVTSANTMRYRKPDDRERRKVIVAEKDRVNHGRKTSRRGQVSHCRRCCALQTTYKLTAIHHSRCVCWTARTTPGRHRTAKVVELAVMLTRTGLDCQGPGQGQGLSNTNSKNGLFDTMPHNAHHYLQ